MMTIRLPEDLEKRLSRLARDTHRTKSYYVRKAIERFLDTKADRLIALAIAEETENNDLKKGDLSC